MAPRLLTLILGVVLYLGITANGQPKQEAKLKSLHVISDIKYRFATTLVSMKYYNPYNTSVSADLHINMPRNSFVSNFSMEIDGNVTVGEVKEKAEAKAIYDHAVDTHQSASIIGVKHRFTNVFDISVHVEPQKYVVYNLTYQELLTRQNNKYRHVVHLSNSGIIDDFLVEVFIKEPQDIIDLSVPEIKDDKLTAITDDKELESASIDYISSKEVYIKYNPSRKQQEEISEKHGVAGLLRVQYDVDRQNNSNLIYAVDGYFVHFFTSDSLPSLPKHIIFMLDVSGSMGGRKIEQLKKAMENILNQLDPKVDKFLIGKFSYDVSWMMKEFLIANDVNKKIGEKYIKTLVASGSTNINSALLESIEVHKPALTSATKSIIVFLTDGKPTSGLTNLELIKKNVREANKNVSLFALCFGGNCDSKFLREIATENGGFNRKIYVDSDSKLQIENFYEEISNILLKDITFVYLDGAVNTSATSFSSYFKGSELVVSGALSQEYQPTINVSLTMTNRLGYNNEILELELYNDDFNIYDDDFSQNSSLTNIQSFSEITEKTYVYLTLKQLLKEDRTTEVRNDILHLALKYNFVTPLTSMVVTKTKVKEELFEEEKDAPYLQNVQHGPQGLGKPIFYTSFIHGLSRFPRPTIPVAASYGLPRFPRPTYGLPRFPRPTYGLPRFPTPAYDQSGNDLSGFPRPTFPIAASAGIPARTTTTTLPILTYSPGILIKPLNCQSYLCFTDNIQCRNQTSILLLANKYSGVYGRVKKVSDTNCLETLNTIVVKRGFDNKTISSTPKGKFFPPIILQVGPLSSITVNQYESVNSETFLSVHFNILDNVQSGGILSDYATDFQCTESLNHMVLSHKAGVYNKVNYKTASGSLNHCFKM